MGHRVDERLLCAIQKGRRHFIDNAHDLVAHGGIVVFAAFGQEVSDPQIYRINEETRKTDGLEKIHNPHGRTNEGAATLCAGIFVRAKETTHQAFERAEKCTSGEKYLDSPLILGGAVI